MRRQRATAALARACVERAGKESAEPLAETCEICYSREYHNFAVVAQLDRASAS